MKKISVIVPIYKVEKYLDRGIESVINQTYRNLEIILVDDGSPDNCPKICDEWAKKDKRIKVVHKKNGGVSSARNAGLKEATGDYIAFFDADDILESSMYEKLFESIKREKSDIALCRFSYYYEETNKEIFVFEKNLNEVRKQGIFAYLLKNEKRRKKSCIETTNVMGSVCRGLYSVDVVKGIEFEKVIIAEDLIFLVDMFNKNPKVSIVDEYLYKYVQRKSSAVHQVTEKKIRDQFKSQAIVCERLKNKVKDEELKANKFHIYSKNVLEIAKQRDKKLLDLVLKSEYVKNFYSKENYLYAKRLTNSFKLRFAYFIAYHKWFLIYSLICKFL